MTNLLYAAYTWNSQNKLVSNPEFDRWVEEMISIISEYFDSENEKN
jgi:hypothetical protein